jgi:hypothetical protein
MRGEAMVMVVRLTTIFPTQKNSMSLNTSNTTTRGAEVEVIPHHILPHDHQRIPNPVMNVRNKSLDKPTDSVIVYIVINKAYS